MTGRADAACPHCRPFNRVPAARLDDHPDRGRYQRRLFTGKPVESTKAASVRPGERRDLPTPALFRGGREIARQAGAPGAQYIVRWTAAQTQR